MCVFEVGIEDSELRLGLWLEGVEKMFLVFRTKGVSPGGDSHDIQGNSLAIQVMDFKPQFMQD